MTNLDIPWVRFHGTVGKDPITKKLQPQYPIWKTFVSMYCISVPLCFICIIPAAVFAIAQSWLEEIFNKSVGPDSLWTYLPSIFGALVVALFSRNYEGLATWMTDIENHRTESQYDRHK